MHVVGVDGCRKGWFAVALDSKDNWKIDVFKTFDGLWQSAQPLSVLFIDIPIGLPNSGRRACDRETRKMLGRRGASVFAAPCRDALQAHTYRRACRINKRSTGVQLSIQSWNICAKIGEIDIWLLHNQKARPKVRESHPELCFWALAGGRAMAHSKKSSRGFGERYSLLESACPQTGAIVHGALGRFRRKVLARDDILDALALAVCARISSGMPKTVPLNPPTDKRGLPMEIVYPSSRFT